MSMVAAPALADYFGGRYADSAIHTHDSIESNSADYDKIQPKWSASMDHLETVTDMSTVAVSYDQYTDAYWYATDETNFANTGTLGDAYCKTTFPTTSVSNGECDSMKTSSTGLIGRFVIRSVMKSRTPSAATMA
jgi:hypothetical protein